MNQTDDASVALAFGSGIKQGEWLKMRKTTVNALWISEVGLVGYVAK